MQPIELVHNEYLITTDKNKLSVPAIHRWLSEESYWSKGIGYETVQAAFEHSFCIGILHRQAQIGYARLITDYALFAYLADVYVAAAHRNQGLSTRMLQVLLHIDWVQNLQKIMLATRDAHQLYRKYGFSELKFPARMMELSPALLTGMPA
jgi:GNAT superfamily N-acetyltransferase